MNPVAIHASLAPFSHGAFAGGRSYLAEQTRVGSASLNQNTDLTITTEEGDTVTLSIASAVESNVGIHRSGFYAAGQAEYSQTAFFEYSSSRNMAIEINGELNDTELEDIREAVKAIGSMIDDFLSGDLQEMAKDGKLLEELDTISNLNAAFSYQRQVLYGEQEKVEIKSMEPQKGARSSGYRRGHGRLQRLMNRIDRLSDDMADRVKGFRGRRKQLARSVKELFDRYKYGEVDRAPADKMGRDVIQILQTDFVKKIEPSPRQAAGRVHRRVENRFPVRSLTPPQAAENTLATAVQTLTESASFKLTYAA